MSWDSLLGARGDLTRLRKAASKGTSPSGVEDLRLCLEMIKEALSGSDERSVGVGGVTNVWGPSAGSRKSAPGAAGSATGARFSDDLLLSRFVSFGCWPSVALRPRESNSLMPRPPPPDLPGSPSASPPPPEPAAVLLLDDVRALREPIGEVLRRADEGVAERVPVWDGGMVAA